MATYDYKCDECGHEFECDHPISKEPGADCPQCGKFTSHRLISGGSNFVLKGEGWAKDLYAKKQP